MLDRGRTPASAFAPPAFPLSAHRCPGQQLVWRRVCVDLGHELVTSIHTPLRWSNQRPTTAEYHAALQKTSLSASKVSCEGRAGGGLRGGAPAR